MGGREITVATKASENVKEDFESTKVLYKKLLHYYSYIITKILLTFNANCR